MRDNGHSLASIAQAEGLSEGHTRWVLDEAESLIRWERRKDAIKHDALRAEDV
jgi:hypothetical protein